MDDASASRPSIVSGGPLLAQNDPGVPTSTSPFPAGEQPVSAPSLGENACECDDGVAYRWNSLRGPGGRTDVAGLRAAAQHDSGRRQPDNGLAVPPQLGEGGLEPPPLAGTWPSTMRVCLFRHSPLTTPSTSKTPFSRVAQGLLVLFRSPPTLQMAYLATGRNSVENCFGSDFGSAVHGVP
jgi:hypothetical protein